MKKIFSLCAAMMAAMTMSATITNMTCAEAATAALALQDNATSADSVAVTGYVINTNGTVSKGQQTFYMDDTKGSTDKTVQGYWCNLPSGETALNVGDKITVKGKLLNYVKSGSTTHQPEIKNGDVIIVERAVVIIDTLPGTVCELIEEVGALNAGEYSTDYYITEGVVTTANDANTTYNNQTFYFSCDDPAATLQVYNGALMADSQAVAVGDTVEVIGKLMNYNNTQAEMTAAKVLSIKKSQEIVVIDTIKSNVANAVTVGMALENGAYSEDIYAVTGYIDSVAYSFSASKKNMSFFMCDDMAAPSYKFEAYKASTEIELFKGDYVVVIGKLQHYYKAATETQAEVNLVEISNGPAVRQQESGMQDVKVNAEVIKVIRNGQVIILKNNAEFNVLGAKL